MKRYVLVSLLVLMCAPLSASYKAPDELVLFLEKGNPVKLLNDLGSEGMLKKLKGWAKDFSTLEAFGAYFIPNDPHKFTVLHKFTEAEVTDEALLDFLLDECGSELESGTSSTTPLRDAQRTPALKARFEATSARRNYERLATFVLRWDGQAIPVGVDVILAYFNLENPPDIDLCQVSDARTVRDVLETSTRTEEAKIILAHAAPYQSNKVSALKSLIIGCCEGHVPTKLLTQFLADNKQVPSDDDHIDPLFAHGLGTYLNERLADHVSQARTEEVCRSLRNYSASLPKEMKRHSYFWAPLNDKSWEHVSQLAIHCGQHGARMDEYRHYLKSCEGLPYHTLQQMTLVFEPLKDVVAYPRADQVVKLFMNYKARALFKATLLVAPADKDALEKAIDLFTDCVKDNFLDIDSIDYELGKTIGATLDEPSVGALPDAQRQALHDALQCYRSTPPEAPHLVALVRGYCEKNGTKLEDIKSYVDDNRLNIDLIMWSKSKTIGMLLDSKSTEPLVADILALDGIKNYRTPVNALRRLIEKALEDETAFTELEVHYKKHPQDVDSLQMMPGETIGMRILVGIAGTKRKEALAVATLVQNERTETLGVFHALYGEYEKDDTIFKDLKSWVEVFPVGDIDTLMCDQAQPTLGTFGDKINVRKNKDLSSLFKVGRSKDPDRVLPKPKNQPHEVPAQNDGKNKSIFTRKNILIGCIAGVSAYLISQKLKPRAHDENERSVVV